VWLVMFYFDGAKVHNCLKADITNAGAIITPSMNYLTQSYSAA
jgi:hypothetical protein